MRISARADDFLCLSGHPMDSWSSFLERPGNVLGTESHSLTTERCVRLKLLVLMGKYANKTEILLRLSGLVRKLFGTFEKRALAC